MKYSSQHVVGVAALALMLAGFPAFAQKTARSTGKPAASSPSRVVIQQIDTAALQGLIKRDSSRLLLVNFWATWCDPCRDEFPDIVKIDTDFRSKGLDTITISLDDVAEINTEVPKFLRAMKNTMPAYLLNARDPEPAIKFIDANWSGGLPATFLYNQKGEVVFKHFGRVEPKELRAAIEQLVGSKQVAAGR